MKKILILLLLTIILTSGCQKKIISETLPQIDTIYVIENNTIHSKNNDNYYDKGNEFIRKWTDTRYNITDNHDMVLSELIKLFPELPDEYQIEVKKNISTLKKDKEPSELLFVMVDQIIDDKDNKNIVFSAIISVNNKVNGTLTFNQEFLFSNHFEILEIR